MALIDSIRERLLALENIQSNPDSSFNFDAVLRDVERDVLQCGSSEFDARLKAIDSTWPELARLRQIRNFYTDVFEAEQHIRSINVIDRVYFGERIYLRDTVEQFKKRSSEFLDRLKSALPDKVDFVLSLFSRHPVYSPNAAAVVWNETGFPELSEFCGSVRSIGSHLDFLEKHKSHRLFSKALGLVRSRVDLLRESSLVDKVAEYSARLKVIDSPLSEQARLKQTMDYYLKALSVESSLTALNASERFYFRARVECRKGGRSDFIDRLRLVAPDQVDAFVDLCSNRPFYSLNTAAVVWNETGFDDLAEFYGSVRSIGSHLDFLEKHKGRRFFYRALEVVKGRVKLLRESSLQELVANYSARLSALE